MVEINEKIKRLYKLLITKEVISGLRITEETKMEILKSVCDSTKEVKVWDDILKTKKME